MDSDTEKTSSFLKEGTASDLAESVVEKARRRCKYERAEGEGFLGWTTGFSGLDRIIGGITDSGLYLLSGGPGVGKTTLATQIASRVAQKIPVIFLTFENDPVSITEKILCAHLNSRPQYNIRLGRLRRGLESEAKLDALAGLSQKLDSLESLRIVQAESRYNTRSGSIWETDQLENYAGTVIRRSIEAGFPDGVADEHGRPQCLVVVDYLQHWAKRTPEFRNDASLRERVEKLGSALATFGNPNNRIAVLAVASQNRRSGYGQKNRSSPREDEFQSSLSSLKESGDLEYMTDVAMFLVPRTHGFVGSDDVRPVTLEVLKNRYGKTGKVNLNFAPSSARFTGA